MVLRAAIFVTAPIIVGFAIHEPMLAYATLGAVFLTNTEGQPSLLPSWVLLVACFTEAAAFALGTIAAPTGLSPLLLAIFVSIALLARGSLRWSTTSTFTSIMFAVGAGLPGASMSLVASRLELSLLGALFALGGAELHRYLQSRGHSANPTPTPRGQQISWREAVRSAVLLGVVSALGFSIGLGFGLPRDYWIVLTVLIAVRPTLSLTLSFTTTMAIGTIIGAVIAAAITLETNEIPVLLSLLFVFAVLMFATRGVNVGIVQVFFTAFIIILVNIIYPGEGYLAL